MRWIAQLAILVAPATLAQVTFRDVQPILEQKCQSCHRPGEIAPMPLLTYSQTRPWAKAIKDAVLTRAMPPWPADSRFGVFRNDRRISQQEIDTLVAWVVDGAPEGDNPARLDPTPQISGWTIHPDRIITLPDFPVPAKGVVELIDVTLPSGFEKDTWITSIEIRPSDRSVVHHAIVELVPHDNNDEHGVWNIPRQKRGPDGVALKRIEKKDRVRKISVVEAVYVPGAAPIDYRDYGAAKLIPAGSDLLVQMHYTPNGRAVTDHTEIGITLAKTEPARRFITVNPTALRDAAHFRIPARDPNWETQTEVVFNQDGQLVWFLPHMHLRGKDMTYRLEQPDGDWQTLLSVHWNFDWQFGYEPVRPIAVTRGSRLEVTAHFDNSTNNHRNPNPDRDVFWGDQTWEEMMVPWFGLVVAKDVDPAEAVSYPAEFLNPRRPRN